MRKIAAFCTVVAMILFGYQGVAWTAPKAKNPHATYALGKARHCRVDFVKKTERRKVAVRVKVKGKWVTRTESQRYVACVYERPLVSTPTTTTVPTSVGTSAGSSNSPASSVGTSAPTTTTTTPAHITANLDPTFTQDVGNPLMVTWNFSASITDGTLPTGTLTLTVTVRGQVASSGGCLLNVGGSTVGGQCTVTVPQFGQYTVTVSYSGGGNIPASGETEIDTISQFSSTTTVGTAVIGSSTVDSNNNYAVEVDFPVTVSGQGTTPTGSVSASGLTCSTLVAGSATCSETVEQPTSGTTPLSATVSYSGDANNSSSSQSGSATVPTAPDPQPVNVPTTTVCTVATDICTFQSNGGNTINGSAQVTENSVVLHAGTVTFTDATNAVLCVATITDQATATCSAPYSGGNIVQTPVTATYSGSSANVGDAYVDNYQSSFATAIHSN